MKVRTLYDCARWAILFGLIWTTLWFSRGLRSPVPTRTPVPLKSVSERLPSDQLAEFVRSSSSWEEPMLTNLYLSYGGEIYENRLKFQQFLQNRTTVPRSGLTDFELELLYMLIRSSNAVSVYQVGFSNCLATMWMVDAVQRNDPAYGMVRTFASEDVGRCELEFREHMRGHWMLFQIGNGNIGSALDAYGGPHAEHLHVELSFEFDDDFLGSLLNKLSTRSSSHVSFQGVFSHSKKENGAHSSLIDARQVCGRSLATFHRVLESEQDEMLDVGECVASLTPFGESVLEWATQHAGMKQWTTIAMASRLPLMRRLEKTRKFMASTHWFNPETTGMQFTSAIFRFNAARSMNNDPFSWNTGGLLTIVLLHYDFNTLLRVQLRNLASLSESSLKLIRFVIVDDGSPRNHAIDEVRRFLGDTRDLGERSRLEQVIRVFRVDENVDWNIGGARNLGMFVAPTQWGLLMDSDALLPSSGIDGLLAHCRAADKQTRYEQSFKLLRRRSRKGVYSIDWHPGVELIGVDTYWRVGGCDEDFVGNYGTTDIHFKFRLDLFNITRVQLDASTAMMTTLWHQHLVDEPPRDPEPNKKLNALKRKTNDWSLRCLRFPWHHDHSSPK